MSQQKGSTGQKKPDTKPTDANVLRTQVEELREQRDLNKVLLESSQTALEQANKEAEHFKQEVKRLGKALDGMTQERNDLTQRLSCEMSTKIAMHEMDLENISIKNRPMKIAEEYGNLCSHSWLSVKDALDESFDGSNEEMIGMLRGVMMEMQEIAVQKYKEMTNSIYEMIAVQAEQGAAGKSKPYGIRKMEEPKERRHSEDIALTEKRFESMPDGLKISISDFLRETCSTYDIQGLIQIMLEKFLSKLKEGKHEAKSPVQDVESITALRQTMAKTPEHNQKDIHSYIQDCARIAWKMAAQRPPMTFDAETGVGDKWQGERHQEVFYNSGDPAKPENVVQFYVYPALMHDKHIMKIGKVFCGPKNDDKKTEAEH